MNKLLIAVLIILIIGDLIGLLAVYKYFGAKKAIQYVHEDLDASNKSIEYLSGLLDKVYSKKMIFLHHSVGNGILTRGGLRDSLLEMGIFIKGATYGDEIGNKTDMCDWLPKFQTNMSQIFNFKYHPNIYYSDGQSNDIVMFKSCYPNSNIVGDGTLPGDPHSQERTLANYKATFESIGAEMRKYPEKLFIYLTAPPLIAESTSPENARRAKEFNAWLTAEYLPQYEQESPTKNFKIFDLFNVLSDENGFLREEFRREDRTNSHPNPLGSQTAAAKFLEFFRPINENWPIGNQ